MLWFGAQRMWFGLACCLVFSTLVLIFRETIGNMRTISLARARELRQTALDERASELSLSITRSGHEAQQPYILFLRQFSSDGEIHAKVPSSGNSFDVMPIESRLALGFEGRFATVSFRSPIGGPEVWGEAWAAMPLDITPYHQDFHRYAGRLFYNRPGEITASDSDWIDTFRRLSAHACIIVSLPLDASRSPSQSATIFEIKDLHDQNLLQRCVFVMPPDQSVWLMWPTDETEDRPGQVRSGLSPREFKVSTLWESTRTKLIESGIVIPEFVDTADGVRLFSLNAGGCTMATVFARDLGNPSRYLKSLGIEAP